MPAAATGATSPARKWLGLLIGLSLSIAAAWLFFRNVSPDDLAEAFAGLNAGWIAVGFAMLAGDFTLRSWRWTMMLRVANPQVNFAAAAPAFMASIALNNVLPFRAGDVTRALVFPPRLGIGRGFAAATLVVERLLDLVFVLLLMAGGLFLARSRLGEANFIRDMAGFGAALAMLGVVAVLGGFVLAPHLQALFARSASGRRGAAGAALRAGANILGSVRQLRSARLWVLILPASALIWLFEAGVFWAVLSGFGVPNPVADAALLGSVGTLATLVPSTPGYIGTFHLAVQQAATLLGLSRGSGSSIAILSHAILWLGTTLVGLTCLFAVGRRRTRDTNLQSQRAVP